MSRTILIAGAITIAGILNPALVEAQARLDDRAVIEALVYRNVAAFSARNADKLMADYASEESLLVWDEVVPMQFVGAAAWTKASQDFFRSVSSIRANARDLHVISDGKLACAHFLVDEKFSGLGWRSQ